MTDKLYHSFDHIDYIECQRDGSFINPGLDINEKNLENATQHNLSQDIINNLDFRDDVCPKIDNTEYATGSEGNTDTLQNFYNSINLHGKKIDTDTFNKIPVKYKYNFSWANPQKNPYNKSFVSTINDQMQCGSCWAFAGTYLLQSLISIQYYFKNKITRNIHLSVRSVIENRDKDPCAGGNVSQYISLVNKYGVVPEEDCQYPCNYSLVYTTTDRISWRMQLECSKTNFVRGKGQFTIPIPENFDKIIKIIDNSNKQYTNLNYEKIGTNLVIDFDFADKKCIA